jgi:hypothetical protein
VSILELDPQWAATFLSHKQFHAETGVLRLCCGKTFGMRAGDDVLDG